jgi:hypothetical protein
MAAISQSSKEPAQSHSSATTKSAKTVKSQGVKRVMHDDFKSKTRYACVCVANELVVAAVNEEFANKRSSKGRERETKKQRAFVRHPDQLACEGGWRAK